MTLVREYQPTFVLGDGVTKEFSFLFEEVSANFVKVIVKHSDNSTYVPVFSVDLDSHKVVFGESETAPLDTDLVCIYRETPDLQDTPFRTLQGYDAKALENILSKIVAMIQEIKASGFSTQILQGTPWQLDLLQPADDNASVVIDYNARILKKGLYFQIVSGNLQVSADGNSFIAMPKSADITEFRQLETVLEDLTVIRKLQYKVNNVWYDAEHNAQATADEALDLAQTVQSDLSSHKLNHNNPHETSLSNLTDTDIQGLITGQFLQWDGIKWKNVNQSIVVSWGGILGNITNQTDLMTEFAKYVKTDGSSTMTNPLKMRATSSFQCAIAPFWDGVGFYKLNDDDSVTLIASIETPDGFVPWVTNTYNIGSSLKKWKNLYLAGKAYMSVINNGYDIAVPVTNSADTLALVNADITPLQQQINHLQTIGRFLSFWDATTGLAQTNPQTSPYVYQTGDYFRVGVVASGGGTNYKPTGSSYTTGVASTVVETERLTVGQVYYYDGTNWALAAGGSVAIDGVTIVFDSDDKIQAVGTVNKNTAAGATSTVFDWVGTLAEYQAQNIETLHPDWLCYITDDVSGGESVFAVLYPVGAIYIGTQNTCPLTTIIPGSVWTLIATKIVVDNPNNIPVVGNGINLGLTDGTTNLGIGYKTQDQTIKGRIDFYGNNIGTVGGLGGVSSAAANGKSFGLTTDPTKSGVIADMSSVTTITTNIWRRTA